MPFLKDNTVTMAQATRVIPHYMRRSEPLREDENVADAASNYDCCCSLNGNSPIEAADLPNLMHYDL